MRTVSWRRLVRVVLRILNVILVACSAILPVSLPAGAVRAQSPGDVLLYEDDFEDAEAQGWQLDPGWSVVPADPSWALSGAGHAFAVLRDQAWGAQPFTLKFKFFRQGGGMHVNLMGTGDASGFDRYAIGISSDESNLYLNLFKQINTPPAGNLLVSDPYIYNPGAWYQLEIVYDSGLIQVYLSKSAFETPWLMLSYQDPDPLPPGEISFETLDNSAMLVDDIQIWGPPRPPPQPPITITPSPTPTERTAAPFEYPQCPAGTELSLAEDFDRGFSGQWELEPGWELLDGRLKGEGHRWATIAERAWLDPTIRFYLGFREGRNGMHLSIRMGAEGGSFSRYYFGLNQNRVYLSKQYKGEFIDFNQVEANFDPSVWHPVEIRARGGDLRLSVDGQAWIDSHDDQALGEGLVGLESLDDGYVQIDALWVCAPPSELAPPPPGPVTITPTPVRRITNTPRITRTPTVTPRPAQVQPPPPTASGDGGLDPRLLILIGLVTILLGGFWFFRGRGRPPEQPRRPPPVPGLPPLRLVNLWLTEGSTGAGKAARADRPLHRGLPYSLHVQIQAREGEPRPVPGTAAGDQQNLQVVYFSPADQVRIEDPRATILLPSRGSSTAVHRVIVPQRPGQVRVRVGIFSANNLLQTAVLDAGVMEKGRPRTALLRGIRRWVDYVAVSRFFDRLDQPQPLLSILTNQAPDGSHWIGLYSIAKDSPLQLRNGELHTFSQLKLAQMGLHTRQALAAVEGEKIYRLDYPLPPAGQTLQRRAQDLVDLAVNGYRLYDELFLSHLGARSMPRREEFHLLLGKPGLISIARCRGDAVSIPWAALYSFPLNVDRPAELRVCPKFLDQISRNEWNGASRPGKLYDHLDDPHTCLASPDCPLGGDLADHTVCPFGFWGLMHTIEQPLQQVSPTPVDQVPAELQNPAWEQNARIDILPGSPVRCGMTAYTGIDGADLHRAAITALRSPQEFSLQYAQDLKRVRALFKEAGWHLLYFFVHGVVDDKKKVFSIKFGDPRRPAVLSSAGLVPFPVPWAHQPHPLVILNGCETMAPTPELVHGFMGKLRGLGASGVIGTEVKVWSDLARPFGEQLLEALLSGETAGGALLRLRRNLQRQGNPLGLIYTLYAPAGLHLHQGDACPCGQVEAPAAAPQAKPTRS